MNSKSMFLIMAMAAGTLSSCVSNEDVYDPEKAEAMKLAKYEAAFVKKYGKVDPKQDWGFGEAEAATKAVTRGTIVGGSIADAVAYEDVPKPITEDEKSEGGDVVTAFRENRGETVSVNWSDFFVQHVYAGNHIYDGVNGSAQMNQLQCGNNVHIDSFNAGSGRQQSDNIEFIVGKDENNQDIRKTVSADFVLVANSGTDFAYLNSYEEGNNQWHYSEYIVKKINGAYYVGFDFSSVKDNLGGDGIYDDWIIKISPAKYKNAHRIMAEDLAVGVGDFDFNDVVFDAVIRQEYWPSFNGAVITLRAAGGTMPLYIGKDKSSAQEVHKLFDVDTKTMVNTQIRGEKAPVMFRLEGVTSLSDINIYVGDSTEPLTAKAGTAPAKLCCPATYDWTKECQPIDQKYESFLKAVADGGLRWYEGTTPNW